MNLKQYIITLDKMELLEKVLFLVIKLQNACEKENLDKCLSAVKKEIIKIQTIELSDKRLAAAKKQLLGQLAISSDNGEAQCLSMGKSLLAYGKIQTTAETVRQVESVTAAEIRDAARKIFAPGLTSRMIML